MHERKALVLGGTGLIGKELIQQLIESPDYDHIYVLVRRPTGVDHAKVKEVQVDFDQLEKYKNYFKVEDVFCALGTTIKKAKTKSAFRRVDFDYVVEAGKYAKKMGARFLVVTAIGANKKSPFFYTKVKGEVERELIRLNLKGLHIFRPSLLLGKREEFRLGEQMGTYFSKIFNYTLWGPFRKYRSIEGATVAKAMLKVALKEQRGTHIYQSHEIQKEAKR